jgi:hypothetical protein
MTIFLVGSYPEIGFMAPHDEMSSFSEPCSMYGPEEIT